MTSPPRIELDKEFSDQLTVHKNIGQEIVVTTVDKVRICLMETRDCLTTKREWATPLALCLALLSTLVAADFRDYLLPKAVWQAMYILGTIIAGTWLVKAGSAAWLNRKKGSIEEIVRRLKASGAPGGGSGGDAA